MIFMAALLIGFVDHGKGRPVEIHQEMRDELDGTRLDIVNDESDEDSEYRFDKKNLTEFKVIWIRSGKTRRDVMVQVQFSDGEDIVHGVLNVVYLKKRGKWVYHDVDSLNLVRGDL